MTSITICPLDEVLPLINTLYYEGMTFLQLWTAPYSARPIKMEERGTGTC